MQFQTIIALFFAKINFMYLFLHHRNIFKYFYKVISLQIQPLSSHINIYRSLQSPMQSEPTIYTQYIKEREKERERTASWRDGKSFRQWSPYIEADNVSRTGMRRNPLSSSATLSKV